MKFREFARKAKISEHVIANINAHITLKAQDVATCSRADPRIKKFFEFKIAHQDVVILKVDKSNDIAFLPKESYHKKLKELFSDKQKFVPMKDVSIKEQVKKYNEILADTLEKYLSKETLKKLKPKNSFADCYGLLKLHKPSASLRPITAALNGLVSNAEKFLFNIFSPMVSKTMVSKLLPPPSKSALLKFLMGVLTKFNIF